MYDVYLEEIKIENVRHLKEVTIPVGKDKKNLIITGKNGSGKTSLLQAIAGQLNYLTTKGDYKNVEKNIQHRRNNIEGYKKSANTGDMLLREEKFMKREEDELQIAKQGLEIEYSISRSDIHMGFVKGEFIVANYIATRTFEADIPSHVEKITLQDTYTINDSPRKEFIKYILDLKMTEALAKTSGKEEKARKIHDWFVNFENLLKRIFDDDTVELTFDEETFVFSIHQKGREPFSFNELSDGFAAILDIVVDLMVRMEKHLKGGLSFDLPGIVLIDEIETHLHLELQKNVLDFLMSVFPNIQFIVTTHSPFILNSAKNSVIYDLENRTLVKDGLTDLSYEGVVKGYFKVDDLSRELRTKFDRYKELTGKIELSDEEIEEMANIEMYLDEIPDYLELKISSEYRRMKADFEKREDL